MLAAHDAVTIRSVGELIDSERTRQGFETLEHPEHVARIIVALFRGIGVMRALNEGLLDDSFLETAMAFLARGLMTAEAPTPT